MAAFEINARFSDFATQWMKHRTTDERRRRALGRFYRKACKVPPSADAGVPGRVENPGVPAAALGPAAGEFSCNCVHIVQDSFTSTMSCTLESSGV